MKKATGTVLGAAGVIAILTLLSRIMGLVRKLAQSWAMADGPVATAYDTSNTIPNVLFEVAAGGALAGAVIPLISGFLAKKMERELSQTVSALIGWILLVSVPLAGLVALFAHPIVSVVFGSGSDPSVVNLSASLLRMFALQIPLYGLSVVFTGVLQAHGKFVLPALSPLLSSIVVTGVFVVYALNVGPDVSPDELSTTAIYWLGWGTTAGVVAFSLPQLIPVLRLATIRPTLSFPPGVARHTLRLAGAGLGALVAQQIAIVAIMYTANSLGGEGTYATYNYSYSVFMVPYAVLAVPIATAVFPRISRAVGMGDTKETGILVSRSTRLVLAAGMLSGALLYGLATPAANIIAVGRDIEGLATAMRAMSIGLVGFSLLYHGARVLYALDAGRKVIATNSLAWGAVVVGLGVAHVADVSGRTPTLVAIGIAMSVGLTIGVGAVIGAIRSELGPGATAGFGRLIAIFVPVAVVIAVGGRWVTDSVTTAVGGISGALLGAVVGGVLILVVGLGSLYVIDRPAVRAMTGNDDGGDSGEQPEESDGSGTMTGPATSEESSQ